MRRESGRGEIRDLFVDERCGRVFLGFLSTANVGGGGVPGPAKENAESETSEWKYREWEERRPRNCFMSFFPFAFSFVIP